MEKFSSARRSTVGIAAPLWKGRTGRDNRNMFYIRLQIKIDIRRGSIKDKSSLLRRRSLGSSRVPKERLRRRLRQEWMLIEKKKLLTVMFQLFSVAKTFPSSTSNSGTSTSNREENTSKCQKKPALQCFKRPDVRDRHNAFCWGLTLYVVPSPQSYCRCLPL